MKLKGAHANVYLGMLLTSSIDFSPINEFEYHGFKWPVAIVQAWEFNAMA